MSGRGWCVEVLNDDAAYVSINQLCSAGMFSGTIGIGGSVGGNGGADLFKQPH